jgi:beta-glucosidase-like glycosyl hydrolase
MLGYQSMDGVPITANRWLLNDVLKQEWGFTGTLVTDWDNVGAWSGSSRSAPTTPRPRRSRSAPATTWS